MPQTGQLVELNPSMPRVQDFTKPPPVESGGGGSVGTSADYARFCQMILNGGQLNGVRILSPASIALIGTDLLEPTVMGDPDRPRIFSFGGDALGFGVDFAVVKQPLQLGSLEGKGSIWWGGAAGTWFWIDPTNDLFFLGMIQRFGGSMTGNDSISVQSQTLVYQALTNPAK
jgi:CubicO group peptidase (beta-lactamase class C family)